MAVPGFQRERGAMTHRLSLERIAAAPRLINPVFLDSPQYHAEVLDDLLGCRMVVKIESLNPIRSFKGRGAELVLSDVAPGSRLVCASAGNFGQAMAYASRARSVALIVYASINANPLKLKRMRALGAEVRLHGEDFDAAKLAAKAFAAESGVRMVEDSLDTGTGEGAATIGLELLRWPAPFDAILLSLGNGALLTGVGRWVKAHVPATQMIGVAARGAPSMYQSWKAGKVISHERINTIADGIGVRLPVAEAVADMTGTTDDVVLVSDATILQAMRLLHAHLGVVVEPSGAAGVAAILEDRPRYAGQLVATVICGSNLTQAQVHEWLS